MEVDMSLEEEDRNLVVLLCHHPLVASKSSRVT